MFGDKSKKARSGGLETLIGPRVVIHGDISFSGGLYIEGKVIGKVSADDGQQAVVTVAEAGCIEGEVRVPVAVVCGSVVGDVFASERIELAPKARVRGNIHYKVVEMAAGAMITGRLIHADTPLAQLAGPDSEPVELAECPGFTPVRA
jgi:cytoskeletal protein CcmA (bactofilin family)